MIRCNARAPAPVHGDIDDLGSVQHEDPVERQHRRDRRKRRQHARSPEPLRVRADLARFCARRVEIAEQDRGQLAPALDEIDEIVRVPGIDAVFIGRGDLTAALGAPSMTSAETHEVVAPIMAAARKANMPIIMLSPDRKDAEAMKALGASAFMVSSDHGFMRSAALAAMQEFAGPLG